MLLILVSSIVGAVLGAVLAGNLGALLGSVVAAVGAAVWQLWRLEGRERLAAGHGPPAQERHRLICVPCATAADCVLLREAGAGRFTDVIQCSLMGREGPVTCGKECLRFMNDVAPPRAARQEG